MTLKKGDVCTGVITEVQYPNRGNVTVETCTRGTVPVEIPYGTGDNREESENLRVIVKNGIPGQTIRYRISKKRTGRCEGQLLEVMEQSPLQTEPAGCSIFPACGGCLYRTMNYQAQLGMKEAQIRDLMTGALHRGGQDEVPFEGIVGSPEPDHYRNKMEFSFGDAVKDGPLTLGLHKKGSVYDILTATDCQIVHRDFNRISAYTLRFCTERGWTYMHRISHQGYLRHLLIRRAAVTGEILVDLVTTSQFPEGESTASAAEEIALHAYADGLRQLPLEGGIIGILHTVNDSVADVIQSDRTDILYGRDYFFEKLLGLTFRISPFSFFQTNSRGAELLYENVREYLGDVTGQTVYDLYSGTGTIAQMMAPVCDRVIGVEIVPEAVEAALENARLNGLNNCEFIAGDVLKVLDGIEEKPDTIILDPPRDGIHPKVMPKILAYGVKHIIYISCKATSLARDLPVMMEHGYRVDRIRCTDMFPSTQHVETVVLLSHKKPDSVINVKVEFGEGEGKIPLDNIEKRAESYKPKERVTYKMIKEYIEAKYGFKVHTAYIAEVKRDLGLPMYDAPNAVEELKQPRKHPTPEKVEAIKDALKHFEVI